MTVRHRRIGVWISGLCVAAACVGGAAASAWNRPAGTGLAIFDFGSESGNVFYDAHGQRMPAQIFEKREAGAYVEYGATDWLTLIARPSLDHIALAAPDGGRYAGLGPTEAGAQWQALVFGPAVFAVQGSVDVPGATSRHNPALVGDTARGAEVRLLGGTSLPFPFRPFLDVEGAYRVLSGGGAAQWRADLTAGFYPTERLLVLLQSFTVIPDGSGSPSEPAGRDTRFDLKAVYALSQGWALQGGIFHTAFERGSLRERGFTLAVWHYF